ncbi:MULTISPECIES: hypothetical protein [unclassified Streptomyces]|uniref:hypothetical protein n=1 Tax=unclassified Streptomyces TaxID=2593676 RepID=UPI002E7FC919|nr:hypothetical protein [Streptomyces sp. NBC_00589]WTI42067.1 hypothetical protein OIC96_47505 [Streptomyces sp. NBC_00775]WUB24251.1 hypothetical protein OHA51_02210 [Streptomyces sp. NBC_00589]
MALTAFRRQDCSGEQPATVAVTHSLFALEHVLAERLAVNKPLRDLIERAADARLIAVELAAELDRSRLLRDKLMQGAVISAALSPAGATERSSNSPVA